MNKQLTSIVDLRGRWIFLAQLLALSILGFAYSCNIVKRPKEEPPESTEDLEGWRQIMDFAETLRQEQADFERQVWPRYQWPFDLSKYEGVGSRRVPIQSRYNVGKLFLQEFLGADLVDSAYGSAIQYWQQELAPVDAESIRGGLFLDPLRDYQVNPNFSDVYESDSRLNQYVPFDPFFQMLSAGITQSLHDRNPNNKFVPGAILDLLRWELENLKAVVPQQDLVADYHLGVRYGDYFGAWTQQSTKEIHLSALLIRAEIIKQALRHRDQLAALVLECNDYRDGMRYDGRIGAIVTSARAALRQSFSLVLAHELAHIALGSKHRLAINEKEVDQQAVAYAATVHYDLSLGAVELLSRSLDEEKYDYWGYLDYTTQIDRLQELRRLVTEANERRTR